MFAEHIDLSSLEPKQQLTFTFSVQDGEFVIQRIDTESSMRTSDNSAMSSHDGH
jgi:Cu(I)/Ag(I) efflux system membrane fusion protein